MEDPGEELPRPGSDPSSKVLGGSWCATAGSSCRLVVGRMGPFRVLLSSLVCSFFLAFFFRSRGHEYGFLNALLGYLLVFLSVMELGHPVYFARRFVERSLLTRCWPPYAYVFPFVQLYLGASLANGSFVFLVSFFMLVFEGELVVSWFFALLSGRLSPGRCAQAELESDALQKEGPGPNLSDCDSLVSPPVVLFCGVFCVVMSFLNITSVFKSW